MHPLLDSARRPVLGHRGNAAHAPENTLESFRQALALGVDALELDVHATADGQIVVIHDPTVERTTSGRGAVAAMRFDELRRLDAGARFAPDGGASTPYAALGVAVPSLDEVLGEFPATPLLIEIKTPRASSGTRSLIERHDAEDRCVVAGFDHRALVPFLGSGIAIGASRRDLMRLLVKVGLRLPVHRPGMDTVCIPELFHGVPLPVAGLARALSGAGVLVHVWTVDVAATAGRLWRRGVHGIISNDPAVILAERKRLYGD
jgi:glycerophosphoryl diester phosphodiesterase